MSKIVHISEECGDWEGIYVDGKLAAEGHSLDPQQTLDAVDLKYEHHRVNFDALDIYSLPPDIEALHL